MWVWLAYHSRNPPACAIVLADLFSQFFLKCIRTLRETVFDLFVQINEVDLMVDHPNGGTLGGTPLTRSAILSIHDSLIVESISFVGFAPCSETVVMLGTCGMFLACPSLPPLVNATCLLSVRWSSSHR